MEAVLDTNLLYYIVDDSNSQLSSNKIISYLRNNFDSFYISEYAIMEMYTKFRNDINSIISIINFLSQNNIPAIATLNPPHNIVSDEINSKINDPAFFQKLIENTFQLKKNIEASYLCFITTSIATIIISCKCFANNQKLYSDTYATNLFSFLNSNAVQGSPLENCYQNILNQFYIDGKESNFKDSVMETIDLFCETLLTFTEIEKKGYDSSKLDLITNSSIFNTVIAENLSKIKNIENRFSGKKKIFNELEMSNFDMIISYYEQFLLNSNMIPIGRVKYLKSFFYSFFNCKGQKLSKNDIFDSLFLIHYPNQQLFTADSSFQNRIKDFDVKYYNNIMSFINSCEK